MPRVDVSTSNMEEIRKKSHIFGKNKDAKLNAYQKRINETCEELCLQTPQLLLDKGERLKQARVKVHNDGYAYKKGHSHSQQHTDASTPSQLKRMKICKDERDRRILDVSEQMGDLDRLIRIKERRIEEATTTRSFAAADQLAKEVRTYKQERVQLRTELAALQKKEEAQSLQKQQQPATGCKCPANESVVNLTEQSSDSTPTNEAHESEQITCSETFEPVFQ